ncbi:MAG: pantoate--beta-alanine ligase [Paludibacter sp.]|nr:pantoate--beta-alanine ligase [Paludibacter sp.]
MKTASTKKELSLLIEELKSTGKSIGFVPTMGALHRGHFQLVSRCVNENDICVVSIFVNPTQFNNAEDLKKYPRDVESDLELLRGAGCQIVFIPNASEIYNDNELKNRFEFDFGGLDKVMEGKFRPGHFNGVVQIVEKLFRYVQPNRAYFGEKDFQQLSIIHRMVKVLNFDIEIVDCPIVRGPNGLALSSRNERLTTEERKKAVEISKVLFESRNFVPDMNPENLKCRVIEEINKIDVLEVEYFDIVNTETLQTVENWESPTVGCIAVFCGKVRLIDNIRYNS